MRKFKTSYRQRRVRIDSLRVVVQDVENAFDVRLETFRVEFHVGVRRGCGRIQEDSDKRDVRLVMARPSRHVNFVAIADGFLHVAEDLDVNRQHLLMLPQLAQHDRSLLEQVVVGKVDKNFVRRVLARRLQEVDQLLPHFLQLPLLLLNLRQIRIGLKLEHLFLVLRDENVVEQRLDLAPHLYDVLQVRNHQQLVTLQQEVQHVRPRQILDLLDVLGEDL